MTTIDTQREKDIRQLCNDVLNISPIFRDNPNGGYESTCPFCNALEITGGENSSPGIYEIDHKPDCAYLIAKDLSTNIQ